MDRHRRTLSRTATAAVPIAFLALFFAWPLVAILRRSLVVDGRLDVPWGVVTSDLTREVSKIRFNVPHLSLGFGLRYLTPVGPLRLDLGFRPPYLQAIGKRHLSLSDGRAGDGIFGIPVALDLAIGEAF